MSADKPANAVEETVEKVVDTAKSALQQANDLIPGAPVSRGIALDRDEKLTTPTTAKRLPLDATKREFAQHAQQYHSRGVVPQSAIKATGVLISGCRDNQTSQHGDVNGAFTAAFLGAWETAPSRVITAPCTRRCSRR